MIENYELIKKIAINDPFKTLVNKANQEKGTHTLFHNLIFFC